MNANAIFVQQQVRAFESQCAQAVAAIAGARTLPEVLRAADLHPQSWLRTLVRVPLRQVEDAAERKARQLLEAALEDLAALPVPARSNRLALLREDCRYLGRLAPQVQAWALQRLQEMASNA